jgi:hypothetical protein
VTTIAVLNAHHVNPRFISTSLGFCGTPRPRSDKIGYLVDPVKRRYAELPPIPSLPSNTVFCRGPAIALQFSSRLATTADQSGARDDRTIP